MREHVMRDIGRRMAALAASAGLLLTLAGCEWFDPYQREGIWRPTGANQANIAAMVGNPNDLIAGHGDGRTDANPQLIAIGRVSTDVPKSLPSASGGSGGSSSSGGGGASGASGGN
jgi:uncharacterized membrane protein YgcG